jgi:hypothetical protein
MQIKHLELAEANAFVAAHHRHHKPVTGHRFSLGLEVDGRLVGVAIAGRPVAREIDHTTTLEVTRLCTDGTKNACSALYSACRRAAKALGYKRIITYILASESGTSLRAAGWSYKYTTAHKKGWNTPSRATDKHPACPKKLYTWLKFDMRFFISDFDF